MRSFLIKKNLLGRFSICGANRSFCYNVLTETKDEKLYHENTPVEVAETPMKLEAKTAPEAE